MYDLPNGEQTIRDILAGKPTGTKVWYKEGFFFEVERSYNTGEVINGNQVFMVEFKAQNDKGSEITVKLKMAGHKVYNNYSGMWYQGRFGWVFGRPPSFYEVPGAVASAGMVRWRNGESVDVAGFSYGPLIRDTINNASGREVTVDATVGPAAGESLIVIPK